MRRAVGHPWMVEPSLWVPFRQAKNFVPPTPIKLGVLVSWLTTYPDWEDAVTLWRGFMNGFSLGYEGPRRSRDSHCLISALQHPTIIKEKLAREIALGRIASPFPHWPLPNLQCSQIGLVPKHEPNSFWLIHHLSFPEGGSINDFIDRAQCQVHYASFDKAVSMSGPWGMVG